MSNKEKLLASAQKFLQKGQVARAIKDYEKLVQLDPREVRNRQKLAELYSRERRVDEALETYEGVAKHYADSGFYLKAIAVYKQMQKVDPSRVSIYQRLAELNEKQGLVGNALAEYRSLVEYYEQNQMPGEGLKVLYKMRDLEPDNLNIHVKIAETHVAAAEPDQAREALQETLNHLHQKKDFAKIIRLYQVFLPHFPEDADLQIGYAEALLQEEETDRALEVLKGLLRTHPDHAELLLVLAGAYRKKEDFENERLTFQHLLKNEPDQMEYREGFVRACLAQQEWLRALNELEEWKEDFFGAGKVALLKEFYEQIHGREIGDPRVVQTLQSIYELTGEGDKFFSLLEADSPAPIKPFEVEPGDQDALLEGSVLEEAVEDIEPPVAPADPAEDLSSEATGLGGDGAEEEDAGEIPLEFLEEAEDALAGEPGQEPEAGEEPETPPAAEEEPGELELELELDLDTGTVALAGPDAEPAAEDRDLSIPGDEPAAEAAGVAGEPEAESGALDGLLPGDLGEAPEPAPEETVPTAPSGEAVVPEEAETLELELEPELPEEPETADRAVPDEEEVFALEPEPAAEPTGLGVLGEEEILELEPEPVAPDEAAAALELEEAALLDGEDVLELELEPEPVGPDEGAAPLELGEAAVLDEEDALELEPEPAVLDEAAAALELEDVAVLDEEEVLELEPEPEVPDEALAEPELEDAAVLDEEEILELEPVAEVPDAALAEPELEEAAVLDEEEILELEPEPEALDEAAAELELEEVAVLDEEEVLELEPEPEVPDAALAEPELEDAAVLDEADALALEPESEDLAEVAGEPELVDVVAPAEAEVLELAPEPVVPEEPEPAARAEASLREDLDLEAALTDALGPGAEAPTPPGEPVGEELTAETLGLDAEDLLGDDFGTRPAIGRSPAVDAEAPAASAPGINVQKELDEAEFYFQQGLYDQAEQVCRALLDALPDCEEARDKLAAILAGQEAAAKPAAEEEFFDFAGAVMEEADAAIASVERSEASPFRLDGVFSDVTGEVEEEVDPEDSESHYNLGIAYREMGLLEDAIGEFDKAMRNPARLLDALTLKGMCLCEKGAVDEAERIFLEGLDRPELSDGERTSLQFELGVLYENGGRRQEALDAFREVAELDHFFRDVGEKIAALEGQLGLAGGAPGDSDDSGGKKDRVSYL